MYDLFSDLFDGFDWFMQPTTYKEEKKCPVWDVLIPISDEMASLGAVNVTKCSEVL